MKVFRTIVRVIKSHTIICCVICALITAMPVRATSPTTVYKHVSYYGYSACFPDDWFVLDGDGIKTVYDATTPNPPSALEAADHYFSVGRGCFLLATHPNYSAWIAVHPLSHPTIDGQSTSINALSSLMKSSGFRNEQDVMYGQRAFKRYTMPPFTILAWKPHHVIEGITIYNESKIAPDTLSAIIDSVNTVRCPCLDEAHFNYVSSLNLSYWLPEEWRATVTNAQVTFSTAHQDNCAQLVLINPLIQAETVSALYKVKTQFAGRTFLTHFNFEEAVLSSTYITNIYRYGDNMTFGLTYKSIDHDYAMRFFVFNGQVYYLATIDESRLPQRDLIDILSSIHNHCEWR